MDLQSRKIEFIQEFLKLQSEEAISQLENLLKIKNGTRVDEKQSFKPMSIEEFNDGINQSEDDFKNNRFKTSAKLLSKYSK